MTSTQQPVLQGIEKKKLSWFGHISGQNNISKELLPGEKKMRKASTQLGTGPTSEGWWPKRPFVKPNDHSEQGNDDNNNNNNGRNGSSLTWLATS